MRVGSIADDDDAPVDMRRRQRRRRRPEHLLTRIRKKNHAAPFTGDAEGDRCMLHGIAGTCPSWSVHKPFRHRIAAARAAQFRPQQ